MANLTENFETHLDEDLAAEFRRRCHESGCKPAEVLRDLVCLALKGMTYGEHVAHVRRLAFSMPAASQREVSGT